MVISSMVKKKKKKPQAGVSQKPTTTDTGMPKPNVSQYLIPALGYESVTPQESLKRPY